MPNGSESFCIHDLLHAAASALAPRTARSISVGKSRSSEIPLALHPHLERGTPVVSQVRIGRVVVHEVAAVVQYRRPLVAFDSLKDVVAVAVNQVRAPLGELATELSESPMRFLDHVRPPMERDHQ